MRVATLLVTFVNKPAIAYKLVTSTLRKNVGRHLSFASAHRWGVSRPLENHNYFIFHQKNPIFTFKWFVGCANIYIPLSTSLTLGKKYHLYRSKLQ